MLSLGEPLPRVKDSEYLRILFTGDGKVEREIGRKIVAALVVMRRQSFRFTRPPTVQVGFVCFSIIFEDNLNI